MMKQWIRLLCLSLLSIVTGIASAQTTVKVATQDELASAVSSAAAGSTISITAAGSYTMPNLPQNITIEGTVDGVEFNHTGSGNVANVPKGATFKNVAFNFGNENYHGFQAAGTINMEGCTINGKLFSYGDMNFTNCQFVQDNADYHMWAYSGNVTYNNCTFTNTATGKFLNIYNEDGTKKYTVTVNNCKFVNRATSANKAALNVKATCGAKPMNYDVNVNNCTTEAAFPVASTSYNKIFYNSLIQVDDRSTDVKDNLKVTQDGTILYNAGESAIIEISTVDQLKSFRDAVNNKTSYAGKTIKLTADLDLSGEENWEPIGDVAAYPDKAFKGIFDGSGHTISHLTIDDQTVNWGRAALFGSVSNATIKNLTVTDVNIQSHHYAGAIVGYKGDDTNVTISNCHVKNGSIISTPELLSSGSYDNGDKVGAIVGYAANPTTIDGCSAENLNIAGYRDLGSIAGFIAGTVTNCTAKDVTIVQDNKNGYKTDNMLATCGVIVGGRSTNAAATNEANSHENVTIKVAGIGVAAIGDVKYETLADAANAAKSGDTIKLLADLDNTGNVSLPAGVTLDGDGKNITGTSAVYINKDGGTVQNVNFKNIHNETSKLSAIYGGNLAGTATITGCTFDNCDWDAIQITPVAGANVVITNNMFSDDVTDNVKQQRYIHVQSKQNVDFSATITENVMPGKLTQEPIGVYYPTDKAKIDLTKNYIESINDVCILVADNNGYAGELVFPAYTTAEKQETYSPVAMIKNGNYAANFFATLQAAVDAAEAGATIDILKDFTLTTVTTSPSNKYNVNVNKSVTLNGNGHTITSSEGKRALALTGENNSITIKGLTVINNKADWCVGILDNLTCTFDGTTIDGTNYKGSYNQPVTIGSIDGNGKVTLNVTNGSVIKTNDAGTAHYDIIAWHPADITVTNSKLIGWAGVYLKPDATGSTVKIDGSEMKSTGIKGNSNNFAAIVTESGNNEIEVKDTKISTTPAENTYQSLFTLGGSGNVVKFLGSSTYETTDMTYGAVTYSPGSLFNNKVYFDDATKEAFAKYFTAENGPSISDEKESPINLYPLTYSPEVYYYWFADGKEAGGYYNLADPFNNGWLDNEEFIRLMKDVDLKANLAWAKENASFTMTFGDFKVTKGEYSIALKQGVTVNTDKQTDIFTAADADYKVVETAVEGGYTYTVVAKKYVAQIGEGENVKKFETLEAAFVAAEDGATIKLLADCAGNGIVTPQGKYTTGLTVDFDGHTYTVDGSTVGSTGTETNAFQLLKDNKITFKNGTITSEKAKILVQNYSDLTLEGMTLTLNNANYASAYTLSNNNGNIVIDGSTINANTGGGFAFDVCRYASYPSVNVTVKGESVINGDAEVSASGSDAKDGFKLMLEAGTMTGNIVLDASAKAAMAAAPEKALVMKSETFTKDAPADYKWVTAEEGTLKLVAKEYVAQIGNNKYETLEVAFAAAEDGETVTLLADCTGNGIKAPQGKFTTGLTVDFAGHTYTVDGTTVGSTGTETNGFQLLKDNKITFKGGTITSEKAKILIQNYSDLTLEGMTLTLNNANYTSAYTLSNNNGNIVIDGTTINANPAGGFAFDVCRYSSYPSVGVTVTGESVINGNIEVSASKSDAKDGFKLMLEAGTMTGNIVLDASAKAAMAATPEKATVSKSNTLTAIAAPDGYKWVDNGNGTSTLAPAHYIAAIGDEKYETLQEAINACEAGAETTIKLLVDVEDGSAFEIADSKKNANLNIIIDFDNHSYNVTKNAVGSARTKSQAMHFASGNTLTLKNGTISSAATSEENNLKMMMQNYCDLTLDGMTIDCSNINGGTYPDYSGTTYEYWSLKSVPVFNFNTGNATIKNTTISFRDGDNVGLCVDGGTVALGEGVVVNGAVSAVSGSVTITDGKYSGAVTADQATLKISGGVYTKVPADEYCAEGYIVTDNTDDATKERYHFAVKTKEAAGIYELIHDVPYKYVDGVANAEKITYTRTFEERVVGKFQTWYVPFDYTISEKDLENFKFYKIHLISAANQIGGEVTDNTAIYVYVQEVGANTKLTGNRPYVIKAKNALTDFVFEVNNTKLYAKDNSSRLHVETTDFNYDFYGNYDDYSGEPAYTWYSLNKKGQLQPNSETATLRSYHWYIKATARGENADYAKPNFFIVEGDGETDGINNAQTTEAEIEGIYTLGGIKVEHLVKGVNIIKYTDGRTKKINVK